MTVMFPKTVLRHSIDKASRSLLLRCLLYTSLITGFAAIALFVFPRLFLLLLGTKYLEADTLLRYYGVMMFFFSMSVVITYHNLAIKRYRSIYISATLYLFGLILIGIYHSNMIQVLQILLLTSVIVFCLMTMSIIRVIRAGMG